MIDLGKAGFPSEAYSVYNMLRYSQRNLQKSLHEKILQILVSAGLLKDAYLVFKVSHCLWIRFSIFSAKDVKRSLYPMPSFSLVSLRAGEWESRGNLGNLWRKSRVEGYVHIFCLYKVKRIAGCSIFWHQSLHKFSYKFWKAAISQDFSESISDRSMEKFAYLFMKSGNVNLINDVLKAYHRSRKKISTVNLEFICSFIRRLIFAFILFFLFRKSISFFLDSIISLKLLAYYSCMLVGLITVLKLL